jgi:hypothetical protein
MAELEAAVAAALDGGPLPDDPALKASWRSLAAWAAASEGGADAPRLAEEAAAALPWPREAPGPGGARPPLGLPALAAYQAAVVLGLAWGLLPPEGRERVVRAAARGLASGAVAPAAFAAFVYDRARQDPAGLRGGLIRAMADGLLGTGPALVQAAVAAACAAGPGA